MPQMKMGSKSVEPVATGFSVYEGPEPRDGVYNAIVRNMTMRKGKDSGNLYFNMLVEFEDNVDEKAQYNGFPLWNRIVPGDSDLQQIRVAQLISAVCGRNEANVDFADLDGDEKGKVRKIGGKDPEGTKVKVSVRRKRDNRNSEDFVIEVQDMFPRSGAPATKGTALEVDEDVEPVGAEDGVDPDGVDLDELREELEALTLVKAKKYATDNTELTASDLKGKKLPEVVELILAQYADEDEGEAEDGSEEDDGLDDLDLPELKKEAKAAGATLKDLKGLDEDGIRAWIREQRSEEGSEDEGEEPTQDEEGRWLYDAALAKDRAELVALLVEAGYDADDFDDEDEYGQEDLVNTLVEEDVVAAQEKAPF